MKKAIIVIIVVVVVAAGISTAILLKGFPGIVIGSGNLETKGYTLADFTRIEVSSAFQFEIKQSGSYSVNITADDNIIDRIQVTLEGQTLSIRLGPLVGLRHVTLRALVTLPQLRGLDVSGASRGTVSGFSSTEDLEITVSGASKLTGDAAAGDVDFDVSGASTIELEGSAGDMIDDVSGASRADLEGFTVHNVDANVSGASTSIINLTGRLDANVSGASTLLYIGEPVMGDISVSGASTLREK